MNPYQKPADEFDKDTVRWEDIPGCDNVKRAIEVAATGAHCIALVAVGNYEDGEDLADAAERLGALPFLMLPCPCGWRGTAIEVCDCTPREYREWRNRQRGQYVADMSIRVFQPKSDHLLQLLDGRPMESERDVQARISEARDRLNAAGTLGYDNSLRPLFKSALLQLGLNARQARDVLKVARTIAVMAHANTIGPAHLAEALQYRAPVFSQWRDPSGEEFELTRL